MLHEMMNTEANARNPQPERRNENRRQKEQRRTANDEGRPGGKGDRIPAPERQMRHFDSGNNRPETTPDSLPRSRRKSMRASGGSNTVFRSFKDRNASPNGPTQGESRRGSRATSEPGDRRSRFNRTENNRGEKDFGESHDRPFGEWNRGAGGKIDSTQRDMGQTGQNMKGGRGGGIPQQQGPYGPPGKRRGPQAPRQPLMDDWGKSDKH